MIFQKKWYTDIGDDMNGILLINKEAGFTSRDIVNKIVKKFNTKKVGHTGTLDPIATGVLVVCVGKATKLVNLLTATKKEYIAEVTLGIETDTLDITGTILKEEKVDIKKDKVIEVLNSFKGKYMQEVPNYSAVKINGKKLYEYARENIEVTLPKREVEVENISLIDDLYIKDDHIRFKFVCTVSKGTYIRSLIRDICAKLNVIGCMSNLTRTKQGKFVIEDTKLMDDIEKPDLINIQDVLDIKKIPLSDTEYFKIKNGQIIKNIYNEDEVMFLYNNNVVAIYKTYEKNKDLLKPYIMIGENL